MLRSIGLPELMVILVVAVLLFGGKKIPEVAKGLGEGIRNFKDSLKGDRTANRPTTRSRHRGFLAASAVWTASQSVFQE